MATRRVSRRPVRTAIPLAELTEQRAVLARLSRQSGRGVTKSAASDSK